VFNLFDSQYGLLGMFRNAVLDKLITCSDTTRLRLKVWLIFKSIQVDLEKYRLCWKVTAAQRETDTTREPRMTSH